MLWDDPNDSPMKQRFKNMMFLGGPLTNKDRDSGLPFALAGLVVIVTVVWLLGAFS